MEISIDTVCYTVLSGLSFMLMSVWKCRYRLMNNRTVVVTIMYVMCTAAVRLLAVETPTKPNM